MSLRPPLPLDKVTLSQQGRRESNSIVCPDDSIALPLSCWIVAWLVLRVCASEWISSSQRWGGIRTNQVRGRRRLKESLVVLLASGSLDSDVRCVYKAVARVLPSNSFPGATEQKRERRANPLNVAPAITRP